MSSRKVSVLVADPDSEFHAQSMKDPKAATLGVHWALTGKDAQRMLADANNNFIGTFISAELKDPGAISVVKFAHQHRPARPIYFLHGEEGPPLPEQDLGRIGVQKALKKPLTFAQLVDLVAPSSLFFDANKILEQSKQNQDQLDKELTAEDKAFLPIKAETFFSPTKSFFDVYVRLDSGRYVKILQAGDTFQPDRLMTYLKKGVTQFFLRREAQEGYMSYTDQLAGSALKSEKVSVNTKVELTLNHGEETMSFFRTNGISETSVQYASKFVSNVKTLVDTMEPGKHPMVSGFLADLAAFDHGVSTSMIAAMVGKAMGIAADKSVELVGLASMFHDLGLQNMPPECQAEDEAAMTPEQLETFKTHPTVSVQVLQKLRAVDPAVLQAVAQHHRRRNKKGFPLGTGLGPMNRLSELIGISDEFARLVKKAQQDPKINPVFVMQESVFDGFTFPVVEAFRLVFFLKTD